MNVSPGGGDLLRTGLATISIVALLLGGTKLWLAPPGDARDEPADERRRVASAPGATTSGQGPRPEARALGFAPEPGRYTLIEQTPSLRRHIPIDIEPAEEGGYVLSRAYSLPEPNARGTPPLLADHQLHIPLRIRIGGSGHVLDVVGPDDYFERLDDDHPEVATALRSLRLEEQVDSFGTWLMTHVLSHRDQDGQEWEVPVELLGLGERPTWAGSMTYRMGPTAPCREDGPSTACRVVDIRSTVSPEGSESFSARLWIDRQTGLERRGKLSHTVAGRQHDVSRRLVDGDSMPGATP